MYGYRVKIPPSPPIVKWATKVSVDDYSWRNNEPHGVGYLEFALVTAPSYTVQVGEDPPVEMHGMHMHCVVGDAPIRCAAESGVSVQIASVAVQITGLQWELKRLCREDFDDPDVVKEESFDAFKTDGDKITFTIPASSVMHIKVTLCQKFAQDVFSRT